MFAFLLSWILTLRMALRQNLPKHLRLLLYFPLTQPIGLLIVVTIEAPRVKGAVMSFGLSALLFIFGGRIAESRVREPLTSWWESIGEKEDFSPTYASGTPSVDNVWSHPVFREISIILLEPEQTFWSMK